MLPADYTSRPNCEYCVEKMFLNTNCEKFHKTLMVDTSTKHRLWKFHQTQMVNTSKKYRL